MKKNTLYLLIILLVCLFFLLQSVSAATTIPNPLAPGGVWNFPTLFQKITNAVAVLVGSLSVIMIIISGILYLTSAGSPERVKSAKTALMYAIIGMAVAICAGGISAFILSTLGA